MKNGISIIGYDLNYEYCQISIGTSLDEEPETLYLMDDKEDTELPLIIAKRNEEAPWVTGTEALRLDTMGEGIVIRDLLRLSMDNAKVKVGSEEVSAVTLLTEFIRLSLLRLLMVDLGEQITCIVFTVPKIDEDVITMLKSAASRLGIDKSRIYVQDYKESLYDYISHQSRELWNYDVVLMGYIGTGLYSYKLIKEPLPKGRKKELVSVQEGPVMEVKPGNEGDRKLLIYAQAVFGKSLISSVFLIGKEFEGGWFPEAQNYLCKNRRVFIGRNLYSKGACYGGFRKTGLDHPDAIYLDSYKIVSQISIRLRVRGKEQWVPVAYQGENWYEINREMEVLMDQSTTLMVQVDTIGKNMPVQDVISLEGLFEKQRRTVRLSIRTVFLGKDRCRIIIRDVDFGELRKATGYELVHTLQLENVTFR